MSEITYGNGPLQAAAFVALEEGAIETEVQDGYALLVFATKWQAKNFQYQLPVGLDKVLVAQGYKMLVGLTASGDHAVKLTR